MHCDISISDKESATVACSVLGETTGARWVFEKLSEGGNTPICDAEIVRTRALFGQRTFFRCTMMETFAVDHGLDSLQSRIQACRNSSTGKPDVAVPSPRRRAQRFALLTWFDTIPGKPDSYYYAHVFNSAQVGLIVGATLGLILPWFSGEPLMIVGVFPGSVFLGCLLGAIVGTFSGSLAKWLCERRNKNKCQPSPRN